MTVEEQLLDAMGEVGMDLVDMAEKIRFPRSLLRKALPVAACAALLLGAGLASLNFRSPAPAELGTAPAAMVREETASAEMLLSRYFTYCQDDEARYENVRLACEAIDGTILQAGEEFSFNEILGERTEEKGYVRASAYDDGGEGEIGGGIGQVASTLYCASLQLDLEQLERAANTYVVDYVAAGFDAAVYWGVTDYRFRNSLSVPLRMEAGLENGEVYVEFWGALEDGPQITLGVETLQSVEITEERIDDPALPAGQEVVEQTGSEGVSVRTLQHFPDGGVKVVATSTYEMRSRVVRVGTGE